MTEVSNSSMIKIALTTYLQHSVLTVHHFMLISHQSSIRFVAFDFFSTAAGRTKCTCGSTDFTPWLLCLGLVCLPVLFLANRNLCNFEVKWDSSCNLSWRFRVSQPAEYGNQEVSQHDHSYWDCPLCCYCRCACCIILSILKQLYTSIFHLPQHFFWFSFSLSTTSLDTETFSWFA